LEKESTEKGEVVANETPKPKKTTKAKKSKKQGKTP